MRLPHLEQLAGRMAVVTGANSGIGLAFANALARRGVRCLLVARRANLLAEAAGRCREHGTLAHFLSIDLAQAGAAAACRDYAHSIGLRPSLLFNCAGADPWGGFERLDEEGHERLQMLLVATPLALCRAFLPELCSAPGGAVVNVSSPAALQPMPWKAAYAAGKAALHHASLALHHEWGGRGILVQTLVPGATATAIEESGGAYDCPLRRVPRQDAGTLVEISLAALPRGAALVSTQPRLWLQRLFAALAPPSLLLRTVGRLASPPP